VVASFFLEKGLDFIKTKVLHPAPDRAPLKERKVTNEFTEEHPETVAVADRCCRKPDLPHLPQ